ncbi:MAG TPA: right-handed parallel beta-helix repeat-containing protein [Planctomycetota bacterium]|nr:right-handed parallel beta-helix repeat-containing protein [Planctomycetota bacterium]
MLTGCLVAAVLAGIPAPSASAAEFHVASTGGSDSGPGTKDQPFATLERARDAVRALKAGGGLPPGGVTIWLRGGLHLRESTLQLSKEDSGTEGRPVVYASFPGESARLAGARKLDLARFAAVTEASPVWSRLDPSARGKVRVADLPAQGVRDYGQLRVRGFGDSVGAALELFADGKPLTLARWPDAEQHDILSGPADGRFTLYGSTAPDVGGEYLAVGTADGVNCYRRAQPVGGKIYNFYRRTWKHQGETYTAWFLTTQKSGYPGNADPWWYRYGQGFGPLSPSKDSRATGAPSTVNPESASHGLVKIAEAPGDAALRIFGDRLRRWGQAEEIWLHGYFKHAWADFHVPVKSIDATTRTVNLVKAPPFGIEAGQPFYAENLLEEITRPGEWFLDRKTGQLFVWLPEGTSELLASTLETPLVALRGTAHVQLRDLVIEASRGELLRIDQGSQNLLLRCELRNAGTYAAIISGSGNRVERCHLHGTGEGGVTLDGGERRSLTRANNAVVNCRIHDFARWAWTCKPAVTLSGCGQVVAHNFIHKAPHSAVFYGGNEHVIEFNDIHDVCRYSSDAGAIYGGRNWGYRGSRIRWNYIHDMATFVEGSGVHGIYLDDCLSGVEITGNVLCRITGHGILNGGGRDNVMTNNIMVRCGTAMQGDNRGLVHINNTPGDSWNLRERLAADGVKYQEGVWAAAYPLLARIPNDWAKITAPGALWRAPQGCIFSRNLGFANGAFMGESRTKGEAVFDKYAEIAGNVENQDPLLANEAAGDLTLRPGSPALAIPGFAEIPFGKIGIEPDAHPGSRP